MATSVARASAARGRVGKDEGTGSRTGACALAVDPLEVRCERQGDSQHRPCDRLGVNLHTELRKAIGFGFDRVAKPLMVD